MADRRRRGGGGDRRDREGEPAVTARFLALEGIDGCGKSTQAARLADALRAQGHDVVLTREPGGTALGEGVRNLVLAGGEMSPVAEALLFAAARAQLVAEVVRPALDAGRWVVTDRFVDSSLAYQGAARELGIDDVWQINRPAVEGCLPDLAVVLDVPATVAAARDTGPDDRIEAEGVALQEAVATGYRELAVRFSQRVSIVSGEGTVEQVHARVMGLVAVLA
jgi:dTMP kinase